MSKPAASRSRAEKPKVPPSQTPVVSHEIVPGKFNDNDWYTDELLMLIYVAPAICLAFNSAVV